MTTKACNLNLYLVAVLTFVFFARSVFADSATYEVTFDSTWSPETHPLDFPSSAHYSPLVGATHNTEVSLWELGKFATRGIEVMAELGGTTVLQNEVNGAIRDGTAEFFLRGPGMGTSPATVTYEFDITDTHPLVTLVTMIAPSPDWFVGTQSLNLMPDGEWVGKYVHELLPYDAGTDSGESYRSRDIQSIPKEHIIEITGYPFEGTPPLGTFTFRRLLAGDLNESGDYDAGDIDALSAAIQANSTDTEFDVNQDGSVDAVDRIYWIKELARTFVGDANVDGEFGTSDLTKVFQAGQYEDAIAENSSWETGDWNGDFDFDTSDLVAAFQDGGFEQGPLVAKGVPEPTSLHALFGMTCLFFSRLFRQTGSRC